MEQMTVYRQSQTLAGSQMDHSLTIRVKGDVVSKRKITMNQERKAFPGKDPPFSCRRNKKTC